MRTFANVVKAASITGFALVLVACGGGGGSSSTPGSNVSYPLKTGLQQLTQRVSTLNFTYSGKVNGATISGGGTMTSGSLIPTTFEGIAAYSQTATVTSTITVNGTTFPLSVSSTSYSDYNYLPLGNSSGTSFSVIDTPYSIPGTVSVGSSGTFFTSKTYNNSSKTTLLGTNIYTYNISADTDQSAIFTLTSTSYNTNSVVTNVSRTVYRMTASGYISRLYETGTPTSTGDTLVITYQ